MAARKQADSDPLPYVQVDRSAKPRAALLAGSIGVTPQHALGSLVEWWDLNGDPRELERIALETATGVEPAVVVTHEAAAARFRLASGKDIDPMTLVHLGLLEPAGDRFRVRGMSRYFEPVLGRIRARKAASAGGKASVESRRASIGTAQPRSGAASESASESGQANPEADTEATPKRDRSDAEAGPNPSGQRSAVSGQSLQLHVEDKPRPVGVVLEETLTTDELDVWECWRVECRHPKAVLTRARLKLIRQWLPVYGVTRLQRAIRGCSRSPHHQGKNDRHARYDSLELILRDAKHIEDFEVMS